MADANDVLSLAEARQAINVGASWVARQAELERAVTAISRRLDELCGAVVTRTVTDEAHDGGCRWVTLRKAPISQASATTITTVTEYDNTTSQSLAAETNSTKTANDYLFVAELGRIYRRASNGDTTFPAGRRNVVVTYEAGRYANTAAVDAKFKAAAAKILGRDWPQYAGQWARGGDPLGDAGVFPFFDSLDPIIQRWLPDELRPPGMA